MQILVQYSSELVEAIGLFIGTLLLLRYTRNRVSELPESEKHLGRPLWIASAGVLSLGVASLLTFVDSLGYWDLDMMYYLSIALGAGILSLSAATILGSRWAYGIPLSLLSMMVPMAIFQDVIGGILGASSGAFVAIVATIFFSVPFLLFAYLTVKTRRITSLGLAIVILTYPLILIATSFTDPSIVAVVLSVRLYGPAVLIAAMVLPKTRIGAEVLAYSFAVSSTFYFMSYLLVSSIAGDFMMMLRVTLVAFASVLAIGTSAYSFARWRVSRNPATFALTMFFLVSGFAFLTSALNQTYFISGINAAYVALLLGITSTMILNLSSMVALDWKQVRLLPLIIALPAYMVVLSGWMAGVPSDSLSNLGITMAITGTLQNSIPFGLYSLIWWRMRKVGALGRSRPLFLAIGIILLLTASMSGSTQTLLSSFILLMAYAVWWTGVTGRADRLLGTAE
ncbi:MAG: hypothetical protein ACP6KW_05640 [Candidatus Thorarchaeota archaeon]